MVYTLDMMTESNALTHADCLDSSPYESCDGAVEYRLAMSGTGISYPRCDLHFDARWQTQERLARDYGVPLYNYGDDYDSFGDDY